MKSILLTITMLFILTGCGYHEEITTKTEKSYVYFTGNTKGVEVSIDNGKKFMVKMDEKNRYQYDLKPGKHLIKVYKNGNVIVKREIFLGDGIAKEIEVK